MRKYIVCHIEIVFDIEHEAVLSSTEFIPWFSDFISDVKSVAAELGYSVPNIDPVISKLNGGISKYYTFAIQKEDATIKVIVGVRFSNHTSKLTKEQHIAKIPEAKDADRTEYIDIVQPDVAYVHISIDGKVVRDENAALQIVERKLEAYRDRE